MIISFLRCIYENYSTQLSDFEALPGGYLFPCSPEINWLVPLFPINQKIVFLCSLFPNIVFVPLFPSKCDLCSPVPLKQVPQNPWEGLIFVTPLTRILLLLRVWITLTHRVRITHVGVVWVIAPSRHRR